MIMFMTAMAAAAAAQPAQTAPPNPHAQHQQGAPASHESKSGMGHMSMGQKGECCCTKGADGKMECQMMKGASPRESGGGQHQGHSDH